MKKSNIYRGEIQENSDEGEEGRREKYTVDRRLFLIQQEEHGPSESKVVSKPKSQQEVISNEEFNEIKEKNDNISSKNTNQTNNISPIQPDTATKNTLETKPVIKGKLPVQEEKPFKISQAGMIEGPKMTSKVLIGRYSTIEDARKVQASLSDTQTFMKKINNYYTLQVGVFENPNVAKQTAAKLKMRGYDAWIFQ